MSCEIGCGWTLRDLLLGSQAFREALKELTRERVPLEWAGGQNNLGIVLVDLGSRESGTAKLEEAIPTTLQSESSSRQRGRKKLWAPAVPGPNSVPPPRSLPGWMLSTIKTVMQLRKQKPNIARPSQMSLIKIKRC